MADKEQDVKTDDVSNDEVEKTEKKPAPKAKKKSEKNMDADEVLVKNTIEINPKLEEAKGGTVVVGWGRMNPITSGHEKLVNKIKDVAKKSGGTPTVFLTHSQDAKKNPLSYNDKVMLARKAFGNVIRKSNSKTIIQAMQELQGKYTNVILVVGADRIKEFDTLLQRYNGKDYTFDSIKVVSAGERTDPDSDDAKQMTADTMSASVMRKLAAQGDFETFKKGLPKGLMRNAQDVYDMVRGGMKLAEEMELDEAVLSFQQRRQRALTMRKYKSKIAAARKRMAKRVATKDRLQRKARKKAISIIRAKVAGEKGKNYSNLSPAEKMMIDQKVAKRKGVIDRIAKKLLPKVRRADIARVSGKKINEEFEAFFEARQDPDIKDREGTQPAKYHAGLSKSTKEKRDAHFKKGAKMNDDNPAAYKPAPGDAEAKTKESQHTKKYKAMYGEENDWVCGQCNADPCVCEGDIHEEDMPKKRYHEARKKDGSVKLDRRFRAFRDAAIPQTHTESKLADATKRLKTQHAKERENLSREHESEMDGLKARGLRQQIRDLRKEEFDTDADLLAFIEEVAHDINESLDLDEEKSLDGLKKKAEKSGISYGILKKVYDRGVAAWRTGHRPGTTPQQWGFARVNSFITKGKGTWGKADSDLAAKVRKESVEEDCWSGYKQVGMKKKDGKDVPNCVPEAKSRAQQAAIAIAKKEKIEKQEDGSLSYVKEEVDDLFEKYMDHDRWRLKKAASVTVNKRKYDHALKTLKSIIDRKKKEGGERGPKHSSSYYAAQVAKQYDGVDTRTLVNMLDEEYIFEGWLNEEGGAGDRGTPKVTKRYKKDTPGEDVNEAFEAMLSEEVTQRQIQDLEKFADRLLDKFGVDVEFTRHFADRMNDDRNKPAISIPELQRLFKKIAKNKAKDIKQNANSEAVLKDIQADLNLPVVIKFNRDKEEFEVVNKTIMRKKNFATSNKVIKY